MACRRDSWWAKVGLVEGGLNGKAREHEAAIDCAAMAGFRLHSTTAGELFRVAASAVFVSRD